MCWPKRPVTASMAGPIFAYIKVHSQVFCYLQLENICRRCSQTTDSNNDKQDLVFKKDRYRTKIAAAYSDLAKRGFGQNLAIFNLTFECI